MKFIAIKTADGSITGNISFYCNMLHVTRQGFYKYLVNRDCPWKYQDLAAAMLDIHSEDEYNDSYVRIRMYQALCLRSPEGINIPSERTVYRVMERIGLSHRPNHKPHGITKADRRAYKSEDLLKRNFQSVTPLRKCVTDITEIQASGGKLHISAIFDCFDSAVLGLYIGANMQATLCVNTLDNAMMAYPDLKGAIIRSDRGSQYISQIYRDTIAKYNVIQSMNSDGGCCESMLARMKSELFYGHYDTRKLTKDEIKIKIWRYFMSYWNNRRICSTNGGLPPMVKRRKYYTYREK